MIYFLRAGDSNHVKIGWSKDHTSLIARIRILQTGHPLTLKIIRTIEGAPWGETWLHGFFSGARISGEWFKYHPDMIKVDIPKQKPDVVKKLTSRRPKRLPLVAASALSVYMHEHHIGLPEFASKMQVAHSTVWHWVKGNKFPARPQLMRIIDVTHGKVTANDFLVRPEDVEP